MPNELTLTIGTNSVSQPILGTQAQIRAGIRRFVVSQGHSISGKTDAQVGRIALWLMINWARAESQSLQTQEALEVQKSQIAAAAAADNDFLDPIDTLT